MVLYNIYIQYCSRKNCKILISYSMRKKQDTGQLFIAEVSMLFVLNDLIKMYFAISGALINVRLVPRIEQRVRIMQTKFQMTRPPYAFHDRYYFHCATSIRL